MSEQKEKYLALRVYQFRDAQAFQELYNLHAGALRRFLALKLPAAEDAEELGSETFIRAWEYMTASVVEQPKALLYRIARNLAVDFYRTRRDIVRDEAVMENLPSPEEIEKDLAGRQDAELVLASIKKLKREYQEVLMLHGVSEMDVAEIAGVLGKTTNHVRVLLFRARRALRKLLP